ncbi:hypothetical protein QWZ16_20210 [Vibrio ostreicida]|uniref:Uncharacterized protein n=1 Tax=Vibrio ostreicida TaxID=526588 RepID=A0ABT8BZ03_9VIBR|nr:hypothetical protein [Vibrio ostreicida]MDN3611919.1 hypothetical protein [Vibrio ostreicida]
MPRSVFWEASPCLNVSSKADKAARGSLSAWPEKRGLSCVGCPHLSCQDMALVPHCSVSDEAEHATYGASLKIDRVTVENHDS